SQSFSGIQNLLNGQGGLSNSQAYNTGGTALNALLQNGGNTPQMNQGMYNQGQSTLSQIMQPYDPASANQYWTNTFVDPALKDWNQNIAPQISEQYIAANAQNSSALPTALTKSAQDMNTNLNSELGNILYQGQQANTQNQIAAATKGLDYAELPATLQQQGTQNLLQGTNQGLQYGQTT